MKTKRILIGTLISFPILFIVGTCVGDATTKTTLTDVKILDKEQQMKISKSSTDYRYIVVTNKGTFICENSTLNGKFNNSDIFYRIKEGETYSSITVCGYGKGFFFDYKNILEVVK